jgi:hypothetical protein
MKQKQRTFASKVRPVVLLWTLLVGHIAIAISFIGIGLYVERQASHCVALDLKTRAREAAIRTSIQTMTDTKELRRLALTARDRSDDWHSTAISALSDWGNALLWYSIAPGLTAALLAFSLYGFHHPNRAS